MFLICYCWLCRSIFKTINFPINVDPNRPTFSPGAGKIQNLGVKLYLNHISKSSVKFSFTLNYKLQITCNSMVEIKWCWLLQKRSMFGQVMAKKDLVTSLQNLSVWYFETGRPVNVRCGKWKCYFSQQSSVSKILRLWCR